MAENKPTVPEVAPLIRAYYAMPGHGNGGSLHIVLEDANVRDDHVRWCRNYAEEHGDTAGVQLADLLLRMSKTQRLKLNRMAFYPDFPATVPTDSVPQELS